jgi:hypothetical protein
MKLNNKNLKLVFNYIDNQLNDEQGEYDTETDLIVAVKSAINHLKEKQITINYTNKNNTKCFGSRR